MTYNNSIKREEEIVRNASKYDRFKERSLYAVNKKGSEVVLTDLSPKYNESSIDSNLMICGFPAKEIMTHGFLQPLGGGKQEIPIEVMDKIEALFKYDKQKHNLYFIWCYYYFGKYSQREIADLLGMHIKGTATNVSRALDIANDYIKDALTEAEYSRVLSVTGQSKPLKSDYGRKDGTVFRGKNKNYDNFIKGE